jgi:hypothetical protein
MLSAARSQGIGDLGEVGSIVLETNRQFSVVRGPVPKDKSSPATCPGTRRTSLTKAIIRAAGTTHNGIFCRQNCQRVLPPFSTR